MEMDASENESVWNSEKFIELKKNFLEVKNETVALDVLRRLISIEEKEVDENAWLDCKNLIQTLLENIPVETMLLREQMPLLQAINNSPDNVVSTLADFYTKQEKAIPLMRHEAVAISVAFARRINSTETFESISKCLAPIVSQKEVYEELFHQLNNNKGSEHRFRVYQILLETIKRNQFDDSLLPFFDFLLKDLCNDDVLSQLATIDFLADLAILNTEGARILQRTGFISEMHKLLKKEGSSPDGGFLFSASVKFFGCLSHCYPEIIDMVPEVVNIVLNMIQNLESLDPSSRLLATETFAHLSFASEAKNMMTAKSEITVLQSSFRKLCSATRSGPVELRARIIDSITTIFENVTEEQFNQWFSWAPELPAILTEYVTRPFPEIRATAIQLLAKILKHEKGVEQMMNSRENIEQFKEWLCDSNSESEWFACQLKNDLIRNLREANWSSIDSAIKKKLAHYFDAPRAQTEVATMEL